MKPLNYVKLAHLINSSTGNQPVFHVKRLQSLIARLKKIFANWAQTRKLVQPSQPRHFVSLCFNTLITQKKHVLIALNWQLKLNARIPIICVLSMPQPKLVPSNQARHIAHPNTKHLMEPQLVLIAKRLPYPTSVKATSLFVLLMQPKRHAVPFPTQCYVPPRDKVSAKVLV